MEQHAFKNVNNCLNTNIYFYLDTSGGQSSNPYLNDVHFFNTRVKWKEINRKQSTRWQHLSRSKASMFFSLQIFLVVMKHSNLYLGLVLPSGGWQSLIEICGSLRLRFFCIGV